MENKNIILFEGKQIRKVEHNGDMWFSIYDVVGALTDTTNPKRYWNDLKRRDSELDRVGGTQISYPLKMQTVGGKQSVLCANTEGVFRIIMSVPSPKAEPLKQWLASVGKQHIDEIADPERMSQRQAELYRAKGYPEEWIERRVHSIEARKRLTDEWKKRGVTEGQEYSILTAEIAKATFGVTPTEHGRVKGLTKPDQNLRDHMTHIELLFAALGEESTRLIAIKEDAQGFSENQDAAQEGGKIAGNARRQLEAKTGNKVVSASNFLEIEGKETNKQEQIE